MRGDLVAAFLVAIVVYLYLFLCVSIVRRLQPLLYFSVYILQRGDLDAVSDAVFFGKAAGVD